MRATTKEDPMGLRVDPIGFCRRCCVACMTALGLAAGAAGAAEYETPASRPAREAVPASLAGREDVRVADPVATDGYMYIFTVASPYGEFKVTGIGALNKLAQEIWAIGELRQITRGDAFLDAAKNQLSKPVGFAKDLVTQPGETLRGIPAGVGRLFSNVSTAVSSTRKPSQDSRAQEMLQVGAFKRDYATRFDVDPYTSNQVLDADLEKIGKAGALGLWTASAATMPISGTAGAVLTGTSLSKSFNNILKNEPPARIRNINEEKLTAMGIAPAIIEAFLDDKVYTPRQSLILVDALARLDGARGRDGFLAASLEAADEVEADFFVNTAQILRGYHETQGRITGIRALGPLMIAQTASGVALIPFPLDYGVWTANADQLSQDLKADYAAPGFNGRFEFWVRGTLSARAKEELGTRGFAVTEAIDRRIDIID
jgi:hypothetical protein